VQTGCVAGVVIFRSSGRGCASFTRRLAVLTTTSVATCTRGRVRPLSVSPSARKALPFAGAVIAVGERACRRRQRHSVGRAAGIKGAALFRGYLFAARVRPVATNGEGVVALHVVVVDRLTRRVRGGAKVPTASV